MAKTVYLALEYVNESIAFTVQLMKYLKYLSSSVTSGKVALLWPVGNRDYLFS